MTILDVTNLDFLSEFLTNKSIYGSIGIYILIACIGWSLSEIINKKNAIENLQIKIMYYENPIELFINKTKINLKRKKRMDMEIQITERKEFRSPFINISYPNQIKVTLAKKSQSQARINQAKGNSTIYIEVQGRETTVHVTITRKSDYSGTVGTIEVNALDKNATSDKKICQIEY